MNAIKHSEPALSELLLKEPEALDALCGDAESTASLLPRLVGISALGLGAFALVQGGLAAGPGAELMAPFSAESAHVGLPRAVGVVFLSYAAGFFGAQVASLPSAYFYALLAGVKTHSWRVAAEAMRSQATSSLVLLGLLPVYLAVALGLAMGADPVTSTFGERETARFVLHLGYLLPFVAGLSGVRSMHRNFLGLVRGARKDGERTPMPTLLVLAWSMLFAVLAPLGVLRALHELGG